MATKKRKSTKRRTAARRKKAEQRLPAGLGTLFGGLLLMVLAFVQGDSVWRVLHDVLFGLFGCGSFVLGAAVCCLAVLYTRGEELLSRILKLVLGLIFVCGTVIVFSDIQPQGLSALQMLSACYANGVNAWLSGGAMGFVLGGVLLLLCGRPAANLIMIVLLLCGSLYIFDVTPAEVWVWLCAVTGGSISCVTLCPQRSTPDIQSGTPRCSPAGSASSSSGSGEMTVAVPLEWDALTFFTANLLRITSHTWLSHMLHIMPSIYPLM